VKNTNTLPNLFRTVLHETAHLKIKNSGRFFLERTPEQINEAGYYLFCETDLPNYKPDTTAFDECLSEVFKYVAEGKQISPYLFREGFEKFKEWTLLESESEDYKIRSSIMKNEGKYRMTCKVKLTEEEKIAKRVERLKRLLPKIKEKFNFDFDSEYDIIAEPHCGKRSSYVILAENLSIIRNEKKISPEAKIILGKSDLRRLGFSIVNIN
jgi:hypothetical protein